MSKDKSPIPIGAKNNKLIIIREIAPQIQIGKDGRVRYLRMVECRCDCLNITNTRWCMWKNGSTKSCGCLKKKQEKINLGNKSHGLSKHPMYSVWCSMKGRCYNVKNKAYKNYGGRGIRVCNRWLNFELFFMDMSPTYRHGLEIERKNNDGNYEPLNCIWDTPKNQSNNRRGTIFVNLNGRMLPFTIACEKSNVDKKKVYYKIKRGVSFTDAINQLTK